jgi:hypothetical protein
MRRNGVGLARARSPLNNNTRASTVKSPHSISVPKTMVANYDAVAALTDTFCRDKLNGEYRDLARAMNAAQRTIFVAGNEPAVSGGSPVKSPTHNDL